MERHILHMNKLTMDFLPIILPIASECEFQDVTFSNRDDPSKVQLQSVSLSCCLVQTSGDLKGTVMMSIVYKDLVKGNH